MINWMISDCSSPGTDGSAVDSGRVYLFTGDRCNPQPRFMQTILGDILMV